MFASRLVSALLSCFVAMTGLAAPVVLSAMEGIPQAGTEFIIVTPPWQNASRRVADTGGVVLAQGRLPFFALTYAHDATLPARLQSGGAVIFMDPGLESLLCS